MAKPHILPKMIGQDLVVPVASASNRAKAVTLLADLINTAAGGKANDAGHFNDCPKETISKHLMNSSNKRVLVNLNRWSE